MYEFMLLYSNFVPGSDRKEDDIKPVRQSLPVMAPDSVKLTPLVISSRFSMVTSFRLSLASSFTY